MVNTFLPHADFVKSAESLDNKRLGKQRVEAWQILQALRGQTKGWRNHPATNMWRNHERKLCEYGIAICDEWIKRGFKDSMRDRFFALLGELEECKMPDWFGVKEFHDSHKSNLKRKDNSYYNFVDVDDSQPYLWYDQTNYEVDFNSENKLVATKKIVVFKIGSSKWQSQAIEVNHG